MKRENSMVSKLITAVLGLLLCAYIGYQAYRALYNPVETTSAVYVEVDDAIRVRGYVVRDEKTLVKNYGSGVLESTLEEGERVRNGEAVAVVYRDEASATKKREVSELESEIRQMTTLYAQSNENYDIEKANKQIADSAINLVKFRSEGNFYGVEESVSDLEFNTLMREYIYRDKNELLEVIEGLKTEKNKLASGISEKSRIYATETGYFSRHTDGYESVFTPEAIMELTPTGFTAVCEQYSDSPENAVGKIIANNKWYFSAIVDEKTGQRFNRGKAVKLKFSDRVLPDVDAEIIRKTDPENGEVMVVLMCDTNIASFTQTRAVEANIVVTTYSGLRVPKEALRVNEEGEKGVYCLIDSQVKFKPVDIIFEKDGYYIAAYDTSNTKSLLLYDEIVISSKELENRKIIK